MKVRYENQLSITDFLKPILTGHILRLFQNSSKKDFDNKKLPVNFNGGHAEYYEKWNYLFMYESFNTMCNSKRSNAKEEDHAKQQNKKYGRDNTAGPSRFKRLNCLAILFVVFKMSSNLSGCITSHLIAMKTQV